VTATAEIEKMGRGRVVLVRFVEKLLKYSGDAAWTLSPEGSGPLNLPKTATVLAADILSEQMTALDKDDAYEVISDFTTWHSRELDKLRNTIKTAVKRGAHVRRVFARFDHDAKHMTADDAKAILQEHYTIATECHGYELAVSVDLSEHIGTFTIGGAPISFRPPNGDLSRMSVQHTANDVFGGCWEGALKMRRATRSRNSRQTLFLSFDELCGELEKRDSTWWTRFRRSTNNASATSPGERVSY
jgi:hypothetical protein